MAPFDGRQICLPGYRPCSTTHILSLLLPQVFWNGTTRHSHTGSEIVMFSTFHDIIAHRRIRWEEAGEGGGEGGCCPPLLPPLQKLHGFSRKMLMIKATTLERKHHKIMFLAWFLNLVKTVPTFYHVSLCYWTPDRGSVCHQVVFFKELVPKVVLCKVYHLYLLLIWSIVAHQRCHSKSGQQPFLSFLAFPFRFKGL